MDRYAYVVAATATGDVGEGYADSGSLREIGVSRWVLDVRRNGCWTSRKAERSESGMKEKGPT